jgi:hypothetical protein
MALPRSLMTSPAPQRKVTIPWPIQSNRPRDSRAAFRNPGDASNMSDMLEEERICVCGYGVDYAKEEKVGFLTM